MGEPTQRWTARSIAVALGVAVAVTGLLAGILGYQVRQATQADQARTDALAAAQLYAPDLLSFDYRTLDADFARARKHLTGKAIQEFETSTVKVIGPTAEDVKASVQSEVAAASVVSADADRVEVLLFVNGTVNHSRLAAPRIDQTKVLLTLVKKNGSWLVSEIDSV